MSSYVLQTRVLRPVYEKFISDESVLHVKVKERLPVKNKGYFIHCMVDTYTKLQMIRRNQGLEGR